MYVSSSQPRRVEQEEISAISLKRASSSSYARLASMPSLLPAGRIRGDMRIYLVMLTPAEKLGLSGMALANRVRLAFHKLSDASIREIVAEIEREAKNNQLWYLRDGEVDVIRLLACPMTALAEQVTYVHSVSLTLH